ncbi:MAG TPA: hypothetical protein VHM70_15235 [Polyangiaceae bacterium]|nr:hypothetical protein [Polyangiaceae bacterium]
MPGRLGPMQPSHLVLDSPANRALVAPIGNNQEPDADDAEGAIELDLAAMLRTPALGTEPKDDHAEGPNESGNYELDPLDADFSPEDLDALGQAALGPIGSDPKQPASFGVHLQPFESPDSDDPAAPGELALHPLQDSKFSELISAAVFETAQLDEQGESHELVVPLDLRLPAESSGDSQSSLSSDEEEGLRDASTTPSNLTRVTLERQGRFHVCYRVAGSFACAAAFRDGILLAGESLVSCSSEGVLRELHRLPALATSMLLQAREGWLVVQAGSALYRITEGTWQPQPLPLPKGLKTGGDTCFFTLEDQPKVLAQGMLWDLVGRATQLVRDPSIERVRAVAEPNGEYALHETLAGPRLVHLIHNTEINIDWQRKGWQRADLAWRLAGSANHGVLYSSQGRLGLLSGPDHPVRWFSAGSGLLALTVGLAGNEALVWLARSTQNGRIELLELEFATGSASVIHELEMPNAQASQVHLCWAASERTLHLLTQQEVIALKRLEA